MDTAAISSLDQDRIPELVGKVVARFKFRIGERYDLAAGDVLAFPGKLPHSYKNEDAKRKAQRLWRAGGGAGQGRSLKVRGLMPGYPGKNEWLAPANYNSWIFGAIDETIVPHLIFFRSISFGLLKKWTSIRGSPATHER